MRRLALTVLVALLVAPPALASHPLRTGFYLGPATNATDDSSYARARDAGTSVVRIAANWSDIAPAKKSAGFVPTNPDDHAYDWSVIDQQVGYAVAHELQPLLTVYHAPVWAQSGPGDKSTGAIRVSSSAFAAFATAIATRYDGSHGQPPVTNWEVWNEPNVNIYLSPQFRRGLPAAPAAYRELVNAFADAVHRVRSDEVVVAGGLSPFTVKTGSTVTIGPLRFMRGLLCMSAGPHPHPTCRARVDFDVWSHHPYTSGGPTHHAYNPDDVSLGDLPEMRALLDAAYKAGHIGSTGRPGFWVTEFSWDSKPPDPGAVPLALHARWTAEALYQMWKAGVDLVIWLQLYDDAFTPRSPLQAGLYFERINGKTPKRKPSLTAFTFPFVAYVVPGGAKVWARTPWGNPGTIIVERRVGTAWRPLTTVTSDTFGIVQSKLSAGLTSHDWLRARIGTTYSLPFSLTQPPDLPVNAFGQ